MAESNNIKYMKIHFTWINWSLENRKSIREKISQATEDERMDIAKHAGLDNEFLLRRNKDVVFKNIIYNRILTNKEIYRRVMPKVTEILPKTLHMQIKLQNYLKRKFQKQIFYIHLITILRKYQKWKRQIGLPLNIYNFSLNIT